MGEELVVAEAEILGIPFARSSYPMWVYDRETLAFLEVNEAAVAAYGFSREEFLGMTLLDIRPAEYIREFLRQGDDPRPMGQSTAEKWHNGRAGELVFARRETSGKACAAGTAN
jgi:PAS domain S-box-containing protein